MKKRLLFILSLFVFLGLAGFANQPSQVQAANKYGIARKYTTPKATRGTWYYRDSDQKIHKFTITTHTAEGSKLYVRSNKFFKKNVYNVSSKKRNTFIKKVMKKNIYAGTNYKKGFNVNNWVDLAGDGIYYLPVTRTVNGQKTNALKVATGAGPYTSYYAYKSRTLVETASHIK